MKKILVADIMTRDPITIHPEATLLECAKKMVQKRVGSLLIVKKNKLVGIITQRDILWALIKKSKEDLSKIKSIDISPRKIATIKPTSNIREAIQKMKRVKFERLPVIHEGELAGIITTRDILTFNPEFYPEIEEFAKIREEARKLKRVKKAGEEIIADGICEKCGNRNRLHKSNGMLICHSCDESI